MEVEVEASTLDAILDEFSAETCALWVDVEGAIESVLAGATKTLTAASCIFLEVEEREYWPSQWLRADVDRRLYDAGLLPAARDFQSIYQHNVLYVQRDLRESELYRRLMPEYFSRLAHPPVANDAPAPLLRLLRRGAKKLFSANPS